MIRSIVNKRTLRALGMAALFGGQVLGAGGTAKADAGVRVEVRARAGVEVGANRRAPSPRTSGTTVVRTEHERTRPAPRPTVVRVERERTPPARRSTVVHVDRTPPALRPTVVHVERTRPAPVVVPAVHVEHRRVHPTPAVRARRLAVRLQLTARQTRRVERIFELQVERRARLEVRYRGQAGGDRRAAREARLFAQKRVRTVLHASQRARFDAHVHAVAHRNRAGASNECT